MAAVDEDAELMHRSARTTRNGDDDEDAGLGAFFRGDMVQVLRSDRYALTQPLAELGYYVYPVAVIDQYLKANGMPTAGEMHQIPLARIAEIIGADAVLYVDLKQYGSKFEVVSSNAVVTVTAKLIDTRSETVLWAGSATAQNNSNSNNSGSFLAQLLAAAIVQAIGSKTDVSHGVCRLANAQLFESEGRALPYGPYNPKRTAK